MSASSTIITSILTGLASNQVRSLLAGVEVDDVLEPFGLMRRRSHVGGTVAILGIGIVVGGAAAMLLSPTTGKGVRELLLKKLERGRGVGEQVKSTPESAARPSPPQDNGFHQEWSGHATD